MRTLGQNNECISDIIVGARDFISNIQSSLANFFEWALVDLVAYDPTNPNRARRWEIATFMMIYPDGFHRIVSDIIRLVRMRMVMRIYGDRTGEIQARIDNLRSSTIHIVDCVSAIVPNV